MDKRWLTSKKDYRISLPLKKLIPLKSTTPSIVEVKPVHLDHLKKILSDWFAERKDRLNNIIKLHTGVRGEKGYSITSL